MPEIKPKALASPRIFWKCDKYIRGYPTDETQSAGDSKPVHLRSKAEEAALLLHWLFNTFLTPEPPPPAPAPAVLQPQHLWWAAHASWTPSARAPGFTLKVEKACMQSHTSAEEWGWWGDKGTGRCLCLMQHFSHLSPHHHCPSYSLFLGFCVEKGWFPLQFLL